MSNIYCCIQFAVDLTDVAGKRELSGGVGGMEVN